MSKIYKGSTKTMETFVRANQIIVNNPLPGNGVPSIQFQERLVAVDSETGVQKEIESAGFCSEALTAENIGETFELIHPESGTVIGQSSYQELQVLLYSAYFHVAEKRDADEEAREAILAADEAANQLAIAIFEGDTTLLEDESLSNADIAAMTNLTEEDVEHFRSLLESNEEPAAPEEVPADDPVSLSDEEAAAVAQGMAEEAAEANAEQEAVEAAAEEELENGAE
jgi:hypothetical protein